MRGRFGICGAVVVLAASVALADQTGYEALLNWADLPNAKTGIVARLASSYDRSGGNYDYNHYQWPEGFLDSGAQTEESIATVVTEIAGAGILTRFWMPHAAANTGFNIKITVDEAAPSEAIIDTTSDAFLSGGYGYFQGQMVRTLVGGR